MTLAYKSSNGAHLPRLRGSGVRLVTTPAFKEVVLRVTEAVDHSGIVIVSGANGLGKSVAAQSALDRVHKTRGVEVIAVEAASAADTRVLTELLAEAFGVSVNQRNLSWTRFLIGAAMEDRQFVLWIDEVGNVNREVLLALRGWHDRAGASWSLLLTGTERMVELIRTTQPELISRASRVVAFQPLAPKASVAFAQQLHVRFNATEPLLLRNAHEQWCAGIPRRWAQLLADSLEYSPETDGPFDAETLDLAIRTLAR
ncbi:MAG TPA: ATP-binding protein [Acidimicrobiales bacterium]|nr:ATP-binding protein [Acidimicrobiales bacterium]